MKTRIIVSAVFMVVLMYFSMGALRWSGCCCRPMRQVWTACSILALTELILTLPIVIINRKYYINGFKTLLHRAPTGRTHRRRLGCGARVMAFTR